MKKNVPIEIDGVEYRLRLSISAQRKLEKRYEKRGAPSSVAVCLAACDSPVIFADLLDVCVDWPGSENPKIGGDALYENMVDSGAITGMVDRTKLVTDILVSAGLADREYADAILAGAEKRRGDAVAGVYDELEEGEPSGKENPRKP